MQHTPMSDNWPITIRIDAGGDAPRHLQMKHRIIHTLQKYLLNPPIKLRFSAHRAAALCVASNGAKKQSGQQWYSPR
jgi:hypothetical protein